MFKLDWGPTIGSNGRVRAGFVGTVSELFGLGYALWVCFVGVLPIFFVFFSEFISFRWVFFVLVEDIIPSISEERVYLVDVSNNFFSVWVRDGGGNHSLTVSKISEDIAYSRLALRVDLLDVFGSVVFTSILGSFPGFSYHCFQDLV